MKKIFLCMSMLLGMMVAAFAQKPAVVADNDPGWKRIGQVTASFKTTNESIVVLGADEFQAIKLKVKDAPVHIDRVQVFYESGDMEEINVASELRNGAETRVINLKNPTRDIQKVAFTYRTVANNRGEKADVELYGLKTAAQGDAYRDSKVDDKVNEGVNDAREEADEAKRDADRNADEVKRDVDRTSDEVKRDADRTSDEVERDVQDSEETLDSAATHVGHKVSEAAAKTAAEIADKRHQTKVGPDGQTIYIDQETRYYYINNEGKKVFVTKMQLKDKPDND